MLHPLLISGITIAAVVAIVMGVCAYLILVERKVAAYMQDRIGPNRVGPGGLLQPLADGLKFLLKEEVIPAHADKLLFLAAPAIAMGMALLAFSVVPFGPTTVPPSPPSAQASQEAISQYQKDVEVYQQSYQFLIAPNVDVGIVFVLAVTSLTVYAIILGGWSSNNKYSFIGALRSSAQLVSYEIPMGMAVLGVVLLTGSVNLERILDYQIAHGWNIFFQPLAFLLFMTSAFAECNRLPFDLPEAEQELVGGYHTEYSALKFGMFFLGEYTHMITTSFLMVVLFWGGWHFPGVPESGWLAIILKLVVFFVKVAFFILLYMFVRWTIPRFRFDQLMALAWKVLIPLALGNLICLMVVKHLIATGKIGWGFQWVLLPLSGGLLVGAGYLAARMPVTTKPRKSAASLVGERGVLTP